MGHALANASHFPRIRSATARWPEAPPAHGAHRVRRTLRPVQHAPSGTHRPPRAPTRSSQYAAEQRASCQWPMANGQPYGRINRLRVPSRLGAQPSGFGLDAHPREGQPIGVPARNNRRCPHRVAPVRQAVDAVRKIQPELRPDDCQCLADDAAAARAHPAKTTGRPCPATAGLRRRTEVAAILKRMQAADDVNAAALHHQLGALRSWLATRWPAAIPVVELAVARAPSDSQHVQGRTDLVLRTATGWILMDHKATPQGRDPWGELATT